MEDELKTVAGQTEEIKSNWIAAQGKVQLLEKTKVELEGQARQVAVLKAKNQIDLLDFKIDIVGDHPDDWDEIREMRSTIDAQSERLKRVESIEAKLSNEVFLLRG